jgi:hypothetical protein
VAVAVFTSYIPIIAYAVAPKAVGGALAWTKDWLARYNRPILLVLFAGIGGFYTYKGIAGLLQ